MLCIEASIQISQDDTGELPLTELFHAIAVVFCHVEEAVRVKKDAKRFLYFFLSSLTGLFRSIYQFYSSSCKSLFFRSAPRFLFSLFMPASRSQQELRAYVDIHACTQPCLAEEPEEEEPRATKVNS